MPKLIAVVGPTASGKTSLAIALAKKFGGEIVSADSRQIYRGMDIGTAKPLRGKSQILNHKPQKANGKDPAYVVEGITHHLLDVKNPDEDYAAADFKRDALRAIRGILRRGKLPILAGGTGLYVKTVVENLDIPRVKANPKIRAALEKELAVKGLPHLWGKLVALDPEAAYIVDPKNPRRVIRALEVAISTGKPFTAQRRKGKPLFNALQIGIRQPDAELKRRIETRVDEMIAEGLVEETERLYEKEYGRVKSLEAIGYREIIDYLDGKISLQEAARQIKTNTWRYAKRQLTWFKKDKNIRWVKDAAAAVRIAQEFLA